jgi:transposase
MPKKHLSNNQIADLLNMLKLGKTNAEVAEQFKVSVATVNNHRTRMKREGMVFPTKRGRRPKSDNTQNKKTTSANNKSVLSDVKMDEYKFIINGVEVTVSGKAKNVHVGKESMQINF